jgi:hypothetical protein
MSQCMQKITVKAIDHQGVVLEQQGMPRAARAGGAGGGTGACRSGQEEQG